MVYLFVYSDSVGSREDVIKAMDQIHPILDWRYDISNCFYVVSDATAQTLSHMFREQIPRGRFLFVEITRNRQGFLPKEAWEFITNDR